MTLIKARLIVLASSVVLLGSAIRELDGVRDSSKTQSVPGTAATAPAPSGADRTRIDKPPAPFQIELLELAFKTATAIPVEPHIKDRSKAQEAVVTACLELDQPQRAIGYLQRIDDWRRGACYADVAFYLAKHGDTSQVQRYLDLAGSIADGAEDWRRDRIRVKIARTHALLGQMTQAAEFEAGVVESESGKVAAVKAMTADEAAFNEQMQWIEQVITTGHFDLTRNALSAGVQLYDRFYTNPSQRDRVEATIKAALEKMPVMIRVNLLANLATSSLDHHDQLKALEQANEAQRLVNGSKWEAEDQMAVMARLARLRFQAGDTAQARSEADAALAFFAAQRDKIVNIYRAGALRPLAEAYQSMGDTTAALTVYRQAVDEGVVNPNSRPRAEDLSATCCSMAVHNVEPDETIWTRIRAINEGLGQPW